MSWPGPSEGYAARVTGKPGGEGITVAILGDGVDFSHPDLDGVSYDPYQVHHLNTDGTRLAGVIAARRNGVGMHGVAYNANLVSIVTDDNLYFSSDDRRMAAGIASAAGLTKTYRGQTLFGGDYASVPEASSDIILLTSLGVNTSLYDNVHVPAAMLDAAAAGRIMVTDLGNATISDNPGPQRGHPASRVADPGIAGFAIAVDHLDSDATTRGTFSRSCGSVSQYCIFAPGDVWTTRPGGDYQSHVGIEYAAAYVSGAAALVWGAFPNKSGDEIVERLLSTADNSGVFSDAAIYGRGKLDLGAAMSPVGFTSLSVEGMGMVPVKDSFVDLPPGFGAERAAATLSDAVVYDEQMFPFLQDISTAFRPHESASAPGALDNFLSSLGRSSHVSLPGGKASLALTMADNPVGREGERNLDPRNDDVETWRLQFHPTKDLAIGFGRGQDASGSSNGIVAERVGRTILRDGVGPFATFAGAGSALGVDWQVDDATSFDFVGKEGSGRLGSSRALLTSFGVTHRLDDDLILGARYGALREDGSLLGIRPAGAFGGVSGASTRFVDVSASRRVGEGLTLFTGASFGRTDGVAQGGHSLVSQWQGSRAESFVVGGEFEGLWLSSDRLVVTASSPFRARKAAVRVAVPVEEIADGEVRHELRSIDLTPSGREARLQLIYDTGERRGLSLSLGGYVRAWPDHDASADPELAVAARVSVGF